jgi:prepilin-type N-terminal cleavage/methylation domain-containing protein
VSTEHEDGFTIVELLMAMSIFVIVMFATLNTLDVFGQQTALTNRRNDTEQQARSVVDQLARQLRNLASPTPGHPQAIDKATAYDLVFQSVDATGPNSGANLSNVRRLRYCLDSADPSAGKIWLQVQTWSSAATPTAPSTAACPDSDARWLHSDVAITNVVNRNGGQDRPVWLYDAVATGEISFVRATLAFDLNPERGTHESTLSSGVFLRNQNRAPVAAFTATATGGRHVLLNGSTSFDPDGQPLTYAWYDGTTAIGAGITSDYVAPTAGAHTLTLKVTDPGGLVGDATPQAVTIQ